MFFSWITNRVRNAVLAGFEQAAADIDGTPDQPGALDRLRARLLPQLPAPQAEPEAAPKTNGRRKRQESVT